LAPIDLQGASSRLLTVAWFVNTRCERANPRDLQLREQNWKRYAARIGRSKAAPAEARRAFGEKGFAVPLDAGSGRGGASGAKGGSGAQDCPHVAGILDASQDDEQGSAGSKRRAHEIIERGLSRINQRGNPLRVLGVGETLKEAVRGAEYRESHLGPVHEGGEMFVMAFAGFAEEHSLNATAGTQRFFN